MKHIFKANVLASALTTDMAAVPVCARCRCVLVHRARSNPLFSKEE